MTGLPDEIPAAPERPERMVKIDLPSTLRPGAEGARASLLAVRAAQEAARARARRETTRARVWFGAIVVGITIGVLVLGPRTGQPGPTPRAEPAAEPVAAAPPAPPAAPEPAAPAAAPAPPTARMPAEIPPAPAPAAAAPAAALLPAALAVSSVAPAAAQASAGDCRARFAERRWRIATETCAAAFEARPDDATLALKVAKALHARGRLADAGTWAARTIALDARAAEAFAILAHAEARAGRPTEALQAYRRYLALAPRGWHAAEARAALRASSPTRAAAPSDPADERADNGG